MNSQRGFGLLEILVTLVLLGVGAAGLVAVSRGSLTAAQESRHYEVAMRLAESKLDEFRNFNGVVSATSPLTAYNSIVPGSGSKMVSNGGNSYSYNLSWTVADQYWNDVSAVWQTTVPANYPFSYSGRKLVTVTVGWTDNQNQGRSLQLAGAISPHTSLSQGQLNGGLDTSTRPKPVVEYTPGQVPDVVSVDLGDGVKKETSKPLPTINKQSGSTLVNFESTTYNTANAGKQSLQDMATVYCACKTDVAKMAYLPSKPYYVMSEKVQYWKAGEQKSKNSGIVADNKQMSLCGDCCRDHYDVTDQGFAGYYSPLLLSRSKFVASGGGLQAAPGSNYVDACRFIRLDGVYKPAPDWHLASLTVFPFGFLNVDTNLKNYQAYIAYVVTTHAKWQKSVFGSTADSNWSSVNSTPAILSFNDWLVANGYPTIILNTGVGALQPQLISRGIYVDIMAPSYLNEQVFRDKDGNTVTEPILAKIPFQDVNMTLLSRWAIPNATDATKASVTSQPMADVSEEDSYYGTYSRGRLTVLSSTYSGTTDSPITITATSYQGNSGVVDAPVLPSDIEKAITASVKVSIAGVGQIPNSSINGVIKCLDLKTEVIGQGNDKVTVNSAIPCGDSKRNWGLVSGGVTCKITDIGSPAEISYSCSGMAGASFSLAVSLNKYIVSPSPQNLTLPASGTSAGGCVLVVSETLKNASPAPAVQIPTSCDVKP